MSKKIEAVETEEEVIVMEAPIEEVVVEEETKVLGKFKKSTLIKIGVGTAIVAGGLFILTKIPKYEVVEEIVESVEE